jgi:uncharacterized protein (DUF433 family)
MRSKYENTVVTALKRGWFIEEIEQELRSIEAMTIHNIAKRHGLKARHATPSLMLSKRIAIDAASLGDEATAAKYRVQVSTVRRRVRQWLSIEKSRNGSVTR